MAMEAIVQCMLIDVVLCPLSPIWWDGGGGGRGSQEQSSTYQLGPGVVGVIVQISAASRKSQREAWGKEQRANRKSKWQFSRANGVNVADKGPS